MFHFMGVPKQYYTTYPPMYETRTYDGKRTKHHQLFARKLDCACKECRKYNYRSCIVATNHAPFVTFMDVKEVKETTVDEVDIQKEMILDKFTIAEMKLWLARKGAEERHFMKKGILKRADYVKVVEHVLENPTEFE